MLNRIVEYIGAWCGFGLLPRMDKDETQRLPEQGSARWPRAVALSIAHQETRLHVAENEQSARGEKCEGVAHSCWGLHSLRVPNPFTTLPLLIECRRLKEIHSSDVYTRMGLRRPGMRQPMHILQNQVCVVTGAARGIGRAIAEEFVIEGARVVAADIDLPEMEKTAEELRRRGAEILPLEVDVSDEASVARMVKMAGDKFGAIDVLVNNAGIYPRHKFEETTLEQWERVQSVNVRGCFLCSRAVLPSFKQQGKGKIINLSSVTFWVGQPANLVHYIASKGGVIGFTRSLAHDLGGLNIQVNAISPGGVETEEEKKYATPEQVAAVVALQSLKRRVSPRDIARTTVFLASSDSDIITGQTINVDGGWAMH